MAVYTGWHLIRGHKVMLARGLAEHHAVETKQLKRAARRTNDRSPRDFMPEQIYWPDKNNFEWYHKKKLADANLAPPMLIR